MAKIGTAGLVAIGAIAVKAFKDFSDAQAQTIVSTQMLDNTLENMSAKGLNSVQKIAGEGADIFEFMAEKMDEAGKSAIALGFDDEAAAQSYAKLFSVTKDVNQAMKENQIAMDLARYKGISLEQATKSLTMVHAGATKELKMLGLAVNDNATPMQNMDAIMKQVTGTAEQFATTSAGAMEVAKVSMGNLSESIGGALQPAFTKLFTAVQPILEKIISWAEANPQLIATILGVTAGLFGLLTVVGLIGMVLPAVIAGFGLLASPFTLIALALTGIVLLFTIFKDQIFGFFAFIEENTGIMEFFKGIWAQLSAIFTDTLLPAFQRFWAVIQPFIPVLTAIGKVLGAVVLGAIIGTVEGLKVLIQMFTWLLDIIGKVAGFFIDSVVGSIQAVIDKIKSLIAFVKDLIANLKEIGIGGAIKSIGGKIKGLFGGGQSVDDAIISPNGNVITTHPDDYIMAMKDPSLLAGGAGGINITITGNSFMGRENIAEQIGNDIMNIIKTNMKV